MNVTHCCSLPGSYLSCVLIPDIGQGYTQTRIVLVVIDRCCGSVREKQRTNCLETLSVPIA